ncbi:MAG: hypoxanthine phosphoribosyltransferase [Candidatus Eisenbacteria bacterium]|uniref:Hypoxanthine phosphoribosyltransferase n=1 Tax=Eiseniibacteriota bacterium TaxID=2212470 RepID=A0A538SW77_UNCEI|nr:MAG: hypoxanthine phosphoribosyltransferase [Candidatus Eisenbacteria bacterium]
MTDSHRAVDTEPTVRVLYTAMQIGARVREMGLEIARDLPSTRPLFVGVLKGACMFQCDLARATPLEVDLDFLSVSSYGQGTTSSGTVHIINDLRGDVAGRHVVLCEGVVDSGLTLSNVLELLRDRGAASLRVATLLDKAPCRKVAVPLNYVGWKIGSDFVVGYGLDVNERYRNLPYVGVLEES